MIRIILCILAFIVAITHFLGTNYDLLKENKWSLEVFLSAVMELGFLSFLLYFIINDY